MVAVPFKLPADGPEGEKNVTFSATEENALIIGLDQYGTHRHAVNLPWLHERLTRNTLPLIFAIGHEMAFRAGDHEDNLDSEPALRDDFIEALGEAGGRTYFAGHDHFYDHQRITDPERRPGLSIDQFVVGTAGAPVDQGRDFAGNDGSWAIRHILHVELTYGYILGEVDGTRVSLFFMGRLAPGVFEALDTFAYMAEGQAAPTAAAGR